MDQALTPEQKEFLIDQALQTEEGRIALASSMANPIRLTLDYQGIGRKLLVVDPLPQGALPVYDKDVKIPVVVVGKRGQAPDTIVEGERITVGTWEIISYPQVRFSQVKERRYNLIDRACNVGHDMIELISYKKFRYMLGQLVKSVVLVVETSKNLLNRVNQQEMFSMAIS
jgi:hypothetical protein